MHIIILYFSIILFIYILVGEEVTTPPVGGEFMCDGDSIEGV
jgi:hypothetical protein